MRKALYFAVFLIAWAAPAHATVFGISAGDLIKLKDDKDPRTTEDKIVYYYDRDWVRHPFPNQRVFESWYKDFSGVKEITKEEMAEIRLGKPILYRPGTRLVKIPSIPKVYAVEPGGVLRWIESEAVAKALYGPDWAKRVDDLSEAFFADYKEGAPITVPVWPTGTFVRRASDTALFSIDGLSKRHVAAADAASLHVDEKHVIAASSDLSLYSDRGSVPAGDWKYLDTAQATYIDTLPPPAFDFPVSAGKIVPNNEQVLATFRITSGMPVIIKRLRAQLGGNLWSSSGYSLVPNLADLRYVDLDGQSLFGTTQMDNPGGPVTLTMSGAYTMPANTIRVIELRARVRAGLPKGTSISVTLDEDGTQLADGGNDAPLTDFYPRSGWPTFNLTVGE